MRGRRQEATSAAPVLPGWRGSSHGRPTNRRRRRTPPLHLDWPWRPVAQPDDNGFGGGGGVGRGRGRRLVEGCGAPAGLVAAARRSTRTTMEKRGGGAASAPPIGRGPRPRRRRRLRLAEAPVSRGRGPGERFRVFFPLSLSLALSYEPRGRWWGVIQDPDVGQLLWPPEEGLSGLLPQAESRGSPVERGEPVPCGSRKVGWVAALTLTADP
ncbi:hypothetical protein chiPu_0026301 [Chiloscyllium punctatum]|uniref:Uncharacterized protein n=1 Tax=Chiloscyllium punctatum TaxID=137246 RepID=A0A401THD4_CHIPU|nr:hypothetical protein [Chiloscyllium punctatum]